MWIGLTAIENVEFLYHSKNKPLQLKMTTTNFQSDIPKVTIPSVLQREIFRFIKLKPKDKIPIEPAWQSTKNYRWDDPKLEEHLVAGGNYGVLGGYGNLVIIDCDTEELVDVVESQLPRTFTVTTGGGGKHYYYTCPDLDKPIRLKDKENTNIGDIQGTGKQVVGANSIHPNGLPYQVTTDCEIAEVLAENIKVAFRKYLREFQEGTQQQGQSIKHNLNILDLVPLKGLVRRGEEYQGTHPIHGSEGGHNFCVNPTKNLWHCFRHDCGGDPITWIAIQEGIIQCGDELRSSDFKNVLKIAKEEYGWIEKDEEYLQKIDIKIAKRGEKAFENILMTGHFISEYMSTCESISDAYPEYNFACGLSLLSIAVGKNAVVNVIPKRENLNIYQMLLGRSTTSRKTTSLNNARITLQLGDLEYFILPDDFTPEAIISELSEKPHSIFLRDEMGGFLAGFSKNYQVGLDKFLCIIYDCPPNYRRKLRKENIEIPDPYFCILSATTPQTLSENVTMSNLRDGWLARFIFIFPERKKPRKKLREITEVDDKKRMEMGKWLKKIHVVLREVGKDAKIEFRLSDTMREEYDKWCAEYESYLDKHDDAELLSPFLGRMQRTVLKIAAIFEIGNPDFTDKIKEIKKNNKLNNLNKLTDTESETAPFNFLIYELSDDMVRAAMYYATEFFLPTIAKVVRTVEAYSETDKLEKIFDLAVKFANEKGEITHSKLLQHSGMRGKDFKECVETLVESGRFRVRELTTDKKPANFYTPIQTDLSIESPVVKKPNFSPILKTIDENEEKIDILNEQKTSK